MGWQRMTMCSWDSAERGGPLPGTRAAEALKSYLDSGRKLRQLMGVFGSKRPVLRRVQLLIWRWPMADTTIKKVETESSPKGEMGQRYLVAGKRVSMRLWIDEPGGKLKAPTAREYETVGYVISGSAKLDLEGQTLNLKRGDSWLVPAGAMHQYTIIEPFTAVEATAPPA